MEEQEWVRYSYAISNTKTDMVMFGECSVKPDILPDVSFEDLRPLILERAKMDDFAFDDESDVEIELLSSSLVGK